MVLLAAITAGSYTLGIGAAPTGEDAAVERRDYYETAIRTAFRSSRKAAQARAVTAGRKAGSIGGKRVGGESGERAGRAASESDLAEIAQSEAAAAQADAEAAATEAIPSECVGIPTNISAYTMCLWAYRSR